MATRILFTPDQAKRALSEAIDFAEKYNAEHEDTQMIVRPLPGGNVQIVVEKRPGVHLQHLLETQGEDSSDIPF